MTAKNVRNKRTDGYNTLDGNGGFHVSAALLPFGATNTDLWR